MIGEDGGRIFFLILRIKIGEEENYQDYQKDIEKIYIFFFYIDKGKRIFLSQIEIDKG